MPVLFPHGGPGSGTTPQLWRFFYPAHYRILLFDQRGAGKSTPHAELADNTTPHLIADIELLRRILGIEKLLKTVLNLRHCQALAQTPAEHPAARQTAQLRSPCWRGGMLAGSPKPELLERREKRAVELCREARQAVSPCASSSSTTACWRNAWRRFHG